MKHTLIKLSDYYIIVSDEEIKEGELFFNKDNSSIMQYTASDKRKGFDIMEVGSYWGNIYVKAIASQNPEHNLPNIIFSEEVMKELGIVDIEKYIMHYFGFDSKIMKDWENSLSGNKWADFGNILSLVKQALSDNKERKYTEEDLRKAIEMAREETSVRMNHPEDGNTFDFEVDDIIQSLTPTQWSVEIQVNDANSVTVNKILK